MILCNAECTLTTGPCLYHTMLHVMEPRLPVFVPYNVARHGDKGYPSLHHTMLPVMTRLHPPSHRCRSLSQLVSPSNKTNKKSKICQPQRTPFVISKFVYKDVPISSKMFVPFLNILKMLVASCGVF